MVCHRVSHDKQHVESPKQCRSTSTTSTLKTKSSTPTLTTNLGISTSSMHRESFSDEELVERLKDLIHEFMIRPNRHYVYNTTLR